MEEKAKTTSTSAKKLKETLVIMFINLVLIWFLQLIIDQDLRNRLSTMEIISLFFYPLIIFYLRNNWPKKQKIIDIVLLSILYVFSASIIHESCHIIGLYAIGSKPIEVSLIPKFWEGKFTGGAWVRSEPLNNWLNPIPGLFPYIIDICFLVIGFLILRTKRITNSFWAGLIYVYFCLGPLFDIINNYSITFTGIVEGNDFHGLALGWGGVWANMIGSVFSISAISICILVLILYKNIPLKKSI